VQALGAGDLEGIVTDYAEDAVFISPSGVLRGHGGIRTAFTQLLSDAERRLDPENADLRG
jgi:ketosteroid isomerase-like protein